MKKISLIVLLGIFGIFLQTTNLWAWGEVKKAKENLDMGHLNNAFSILEKYIKKNPADIPANLQLGRYYLLSGNDGLASDLFIRITQKDKSLETRKEIGQFYHEKVVLAGEKKPFHCKHVHDLLISAYDYNKQLAVGNSSRVITFGDKAIKQKKYAYAENFFLLAEWYSPKSVLEKISHRYLYLAALGYKTKALKKRASTVVGQNFVDQVFPGKKMVTIFEKDFTDNETNNEGTVEVFRFGYDGIQSGDTIEIIGKTAGKKYETHEILIWQCKTCNPKWVPTKKGYMREPIPSMNYGAYYGINIPKGFGISAKVKITREVVSKPRFDLLEVNSL